MKKILLIVLAAAAALGAWHCWQKNAMKSEETALKLYGNVEIRQVSLAFLGQI